MIIERLDLKAYGRFTDCSLPLDSGPHRFFLVVGANESGKSTSLRAIGDWLFGFPASTSDDYVHSMKQLRVGGRLLDPATGNVLECLRRKGNKATLLAMDNQTAIADQKLDAFTQGISRTMFEKQFGISHTQLVSGGQEVISGDGDIGELLFSTGAGLGRLRKLKEHLKTEAKAIFGEQSNSSSRLATLINEYQQLAEELRNSTVPQLKYDHLVQELQAAKHRAAEHRERQQSIQQRLLRLEAIYQALPLFAERDTLDRELEPLATVLPLIPGFSEQRRQAEADLANATVERNRRLEEIQSLQRTIEEATIAEDLLACQNEIAALYRELGRFEEQRMQLDERQLRLKNCQASIQRLTRDLQMESDSLFTVEISRALRQQLQMLAKSHSGIVSRSKEAKSALAKIESEHAQVTKQLAETRKPPSAAALQHALRNLGNPQSVLLPLSTLESKQQAARKRLDLLCLKLHGFDGGVDEAVRLKRPSDFEIASHSRSLDSTRQQRDQLQQELQGLQHKMDELTQQRQAIEQSRGLTDLSLFETALNQRDELLASHLRYSTAQQVTPVQQVVALQAAVQEVDRLHQLQLEHREQVVRKLQLEGEAKRLTEQSEQLRQRLQLAVAEHAEAQQSWQQLWEAQGVVAGARSRCATGCCNIRLCWMVGQNIWNWGNNARQRRPEFNRLAVSCSLPCTR